MCSDGDMGSEVIDWDQGVICALMVIWALK
jgi:hypothetical protein